MTLHKLFKELLKLKESDRALIWNALHEADNCKRMCEDLSVKFTDKKLAKFIYARIAKNQPQPCVPTSSSGAPSLKQIEQIICGTNLDIIEEAAEKKGLI